MRLLLSIPSLMPGGAERQLVDLANGLHQRGHQVLVVALATGGPLAEDLDGPEFIILGKQSRMGNVRILWRLVGLCYSFQPKAYYGFLTTSNILGVFLRPFFPRVMFLMGVRASAVDFSLYDYGLAGRMAMRLEAWFSRLANAVVINSQAGFSLCLKRFYPKVRSVIIPNGINTQRFRPDTDQGSTLRTAWGTTSTDFLIGLPARLDPIKDHPTFLRAAALLAAADQKLRFVCLGAGPEDYTAELHRQSDQLGLADRLVWAGGHTDMPAAYNSLDLVCLSSLSEGFPNVLGEAMACGVPCVTTDVGDAALVVGETGVVVPKGDPEALALGMLRQLDRLEREGDALRTACRERIVTQFSVERMVSATEALLQDLCREGR